MRIIPFILVSLCLPLLPAHSSPSSSAVRPQSNAKPLSLSASDRLLARAFKNGISELTVQCTGVVTRKLSDDTWDIPHQRFIIKLASGQTLLIVHNIDLVPRIDRLKLRDRVVVKGEYIWNNLGGLIHLTHRDPDGVGIDGFIRHKGKTYQ
jgi:hypothetical protein